MGQSGLLHAARFGWDNTAAAQERAYISAAGG
jgi:hypothetical protein